MTEQEIKKIIESSFSKSDVCNKLGYHCNGDGFRKVTNLIRKYNLDISHFNRGIFKKIKWEKIHKQCPVCGESFETKKNHSREKTVCSIACSNTFFRSGKKMVTINMEEMVNQFIEKYVLRIMKKNVLFVAGIRMLMFII